MRAPNRMINLPRPRTKEELEAAARGLDFVLDRFGGPDRLKNRVARELGYSRNTISWWFSKGYVGRKAVAEMADVHGVDPRDVRPDIALGESRSGESQETESPDPDTADQDL